MKQIILALTFIHCVLCSGRAYNVPDREEGKCNTDYIPADDSYSTSSCVDRDIYDKKYSHKYYDKCCYIRFRQNGQMLHGCIGLNREQFMDVPEAIERLQKGDKLFYPMSQNFANSKIYELSCNSSYLQIFALSLTLISLLF